MKNFLFVSNCLFIVLYNNWSSVGFNLINISKWNGLISIVFFYYIVFLKYIYLILIFIYRDNGCILFVFLIVEDFFVIYNYDCVGNEVIICECWYNVKLCFFFLISGRMKRINLNCICKNNFVLNIG